ncbi:hypothetical protein JB92DRAFT_2832421 [Gautieria morchelliformis]|nr:hypothetical protein JB92DRAFT_2832421 [Gautieria morchelliformis]
MPPPRVACEACIMGCGCGWGWGSIESGIGVACCLGFVALALANILILACYRRFKGDIFSLSSPPRPSRSPHRRPRPWHTPTVFPRTPTHPPPQPLHPRVARREAAHDVRRHSAHDSDIGVSIYKARLSTVPTLGASADFELLAVSAEMPPTKRGDNKYTLVGLDGTGFVLAVSSSTGAASEPLSDSASELLRDGGGCPYGSGGKGWLARMNSSGGGSGAGEGKELIPRGAFILHDDALLLELSITCVAPRTRKS